uniref:Uncharacterized protein n=1 Tax=Arundo donax TaxID=35708 RepID=A0A0A9DCX9_ARUDO
MMKAEGEIRELNKKLDRLLGFMENLDKWRPTVDSSILELNQSVGKLSARVEALEAAPTTASPPSPPPQSREEDPRGKGHRDATSFQGSADKGQPLSHPWTMVRNSPPTLDLPLIWMGTMLDLVTRVVTGVIIRRNLGYPKSIFLNLMGEHPKIWREKCEKYFAMFKVHVHLWAQFVTIHFPGQCCLVAPNL